MISKIVIGGGTLTALCATFFMRNSLCATLYAIINPIVNWTSAASDNWAEGTFGHKYGRYFLSANANKYWWNDPNRFSYSDDNTKFNNAIEHQKGYGNSSDYVNRICEEIYKKTESSSIGNGDFSFSNIWSYCSPEKPVTIHIYSGYTNKIGGDSTNKKLFVDSNHESNYWFWKIRHADFWSDEGEFSKSKIKGNDVQNNEFKKLVNESKKSLNEFADACEKAYKKDNSDSYSNKDDALLFCSIKLELSNKGISK